MERGSWWATVYGAAELNNQTTNAYTFHFWLFMVSLRTVMALVGVSFSTLIYYNEHKMGFKVPWKSNILPSWT